MDDDALVHIIDDDLLLRDAIGELLSSVSLESRRYASAHQFLSTAGPDMPGCILLDVRLPGGRSGLELLEQFGGLGVKLPVVLMTGYGDIAMSVRAMKAGAIDFLSKPVRAQDLIAAVAAAIAFDRQRRIAETEFTQSREKFESLSRREKQIMALVASGLMNKQVAWKLGINEAAAKITRSAMMLKMDVRSVADLVRLADRLGLQEEPARGLADNRPD